MGVPRSDFMAQSLFLSHDVCPGLGISPLRTNIWLSFCGLQSESRLVRRLCHAMPNHRPGEVNPVEKRLKTGSWRVVRSLIQLIMVLENRPVDPGSIQGRHRPISFIRIRKTLNTRERFFVKLSINNHIEGTKTIL